MSLPTPLLPWQAPVWKALLGRMQSQRLPHALLFHGPPGVGKTQCAQLFAQALLCRDPKQAPCGQCKSCLLFQAQAHPDYLSIEPEESGKAIRIDQIRALSAFLSQTAQQGGRKCIVLGPADALNQNASNALLKSLEEPPPDTNFILVTSAPSLLSATIRSRCQFVVFHTPELAQSQAWLENQDITASQAQIALKNAFGAPLTALSHLQSGHLQQQEALAKQLRDLAAGNASLVDVAKQWLGIEPLTIVDTLFQWLNVAARARWELVDSHLVSSPIRQDLNPSALFQLQTKVFQVKSLLLSSANPNKQLLWEDLLLDWVKVAGAR